MGLFGKKNEGALADVIRCEEHDYLIWKWRPAGSLGKTVRENAIRWGSSLRVKAGEVAVFVNKQKDGPLQDYFEGPEDLTLKPENFPVLSSIIGMAYAGQSPIQAEIYFINLAGINRVEWGVPAFPVSDPRASNLTVQMSARGSFIFNITDYKGFIKLHRLAQFDRTAFETQIFDMVVGLVGATIAQAPEMHAIPVLQIIKSLPKIKAIIEPEIKEAFERDFGVNLKRFDINKIEVDREGPDWETFKAAFVDVESNNLIQQSNRVNLNLDEMQRINAENVAATTAIQREEMQRFQRLQTESQHIAVHQLNRQADVLEKAAENLGSMSSMNLGGVGGGTGGFNPVGVMTGLAIGGVMSGQMASMMNTAGQTMQQNLAAPPPPPQSAYNVSVNGQSTGPYNMTQLRQMASTGQLSREMHVWKQGMSNWDVAGNVAELVPLFAAPPPPPPPTPSGA